MQARDENYLIPVGATIETEGDLDIEAIQLKALMRQIEDARPKTTVVVLDACRDNPVASRTKSASKGLSRVQNPPNNTLVVFAALPGTTATDNGVFAKELATRIVEPNVGIRTVFDKVGQAVRQATGQKQAIQRDDQLSEDVVLVATASVEPVTLSPSALIPAGPAALTAEQIEQQAWDAASRVPMPWRATSAYMRRIPPTDGLLHQLRKSPSPGLEAPVNAVRPHTCTSAHLRHRLRNNHSFQRLTAQPATHRTQPTTRPDLQRLRHVCLEMVVIPAGSFINGQ
jgi:hypothetical protein